MKLLHFIWRIGGVDPEMMAKEEFPYSDKVKATAMGTLVLLGALFIFIVAFDAFRYVVSTTAALVLAALVTALITSLNVTIASSAWQGDVNRKTLIVRGLISAILAIGIGIFDLFAVFHAEIDRAIDQMQKPQREQLQKMVNAKRAKEVAPLEESLERMLKMKKELSTLDAQAIEKELEEIDRRKAELYGRLQQLQGELARLRAEKRTKEQKADELNTLYQCELNGWGRVTTADGKVLQCSKKAGKGSRAEGYKSARDSVLKDIEDLKALMEKLYEKQQSILDEIDTLDKRYMKLKSDLAQAKNLDELEKRIKRTKKELRTARAELEMYRQKLFKDLEEHDLLTKFQGLMALLFGHDESGKGSGDKSEKSKDESNEANRGVLFFSMLLMALVMLFELGPVILGFLVQETAYAKAAHALAKQERIRYELLAM